ncbi:MAG TPA: GAF domain-containing SpoIIE family protein phosphatase [Acidimicrobiales bacterium]|nr:GAF domain-containing SpoIIE family protein phosphatase [Acidimicrobiales bacterium]
MTAGPSPVDGDRAVVEERLRDIQAVTDSALAHLDVDDLLDVLLDRVLALLSCDTAAVLLLDEGSPELVARAARGVEDEVRQGVRVPLGAGFAGRVAAERRPVVLTRVDPTTVTNPILWEKGIRVMLGVPLLSQGQVLGVLHVGRLTDRFFEADDVDLLELAAERVAGAVQASLYQADRSAARVLQRSLLPSALPDTSEIRFASRYLPAEVGGVGGDWYDAFLLPSGHLWVMVGDVVGHDLRAAVVMGRLRSALRAYALEGWSPEEVLRHADRKLQHFEAGATATVVCAVLDPTFDRIQVASAGHPPPVYAGPDRPAVLLPVPPAPPLGVVDDLHPAALRADMDPGAVLLLYTDGLVERRGEPLDVGLERLRAATTAGDPEMVCRRVIDGLIGSRPSRDDVAVLVTHRRTRTSG